MNKVIIVGNNTKEIELKKTNSGKSVCEFTVAVNKKKADGSTSAEFIDCRAWDKSADNISKYLRKGNKILVEGELHTEIYDKNDGSKGKKTLVVVYTYEFLTPKDTQNESTNLLEPEPEPEPEPVEEDFEKSTKLDINSDDLPWY